MIIAELLAALFSIEAIKNEANIVTRGLHYLLIIIISTAARNLLGNIWYLYYRWRTMLRHGYVAAVKPFLILIVIIQTTASLPQCICTFSSARKKKKVQLCPMYML